MEPVALSVARVVWLKPFGVPRPTSCCSQACPRLLRLGLRAIERSVAPLDRYLHVHYVFLSAEYAKDAGFAINDTQVIVDGLEKLQSMFGIRAPRLFIHGLTALLGSAAKISTQDGCGTISAGSTGSSNPMRSPRPPPSREGVKDVRHQQPRTRSSS
jgi:hypothetical protein